MNQTHMFMGFLPLSKWTVWTDSSSESTTSTADGCDQPRGTVSARSHLYSMVLPALSAATAWPCGTKCHVWARSHASSIRSTFTCEFVSHHASQNDPSHGFSCTSPVPGPRWCSCRSHRRRHQHCPSEVLKSNPRVHRSSSSRWSSRVSPPSSQSRPPRRSPSRNPADHRRTRSRHHRPRA